MFNLLLFNNLNVLNFKLIIVNIYLLVIIIITIK